MDDGSEKISVPTSRETGRTSPSHNAALDNAGRKRSEHMAALGTVTRFVVVEGTVGIKAVSARIERNEFVPSLSA